MVVAGLALFVALGGSSYAALKVGSGQIKNNSVGSRDLRNNDVRGRDIRQGTEADSTAGDFGAGGQLVAPGSPITVFDQSAPGPLYTIAFPLSAIAPSGAAPVGLAFAGIGVVGADCVINGVLWP